MTGTGDSLVTSHQGSQATFDEARLRADIVSVWGEHGAHADLFDHMLKLARQRDNLVRHLRVLVSSPVMHVHNVIYIRDVLRKFDA